MRGIGPLSSDLLSAPSTESASTSAASSASAPTTGAQPGRTRRAPRPSCITSASSTRHPPLSTQPCWMKAATCARCPRCIVCSAPKTRSASGVVRPPIRLRSNPSSWPPGRTPSGAGKSPSSRVPRTYFHLYVIIDIHGRYLPGWLLAKRETAEWAVTAETIRNQNVVAEQLTINADRGTSMASKTVALTKRHSFPHCPNDKPYSEAQFKTLSTGQSSLIVLARSRMAALSAGACSSGTTTNTATPGSDSIPRLRSISAAPKASGRACTRSSNSVRHSPRTFRSPGPCSTALARTSKDQ
jgi:hypothetical protein